MKTALQAALLPDRGVLKVSGDDSRQFLNGLVTVDIGKLTPGAARFGALLTPQGKVVADFFIYEAAPSDGGGFFIDCPRALADMLVEKLGFYKLRAKVAVENLSEPLEVMALWGAEAADSEFGPTFADPRLPELGARVILPKGVAGEAAPDLGATLTDAAAYDAHRVTLGVPQGGADFIYGDAFPHEANMDQLGGVDFDKGCYVGQEVVSRVEHRASARRRIVPLAYGYSAPQSGLDVMAGEKSLGKLTSIAPGRGLGMLRLDQLEDALAAGVPITTGNLPVRPFKPDWARYRFPGETQAAQ